MMRYRFVWYGGRYIYVCPCSSSFGRSAVFERDFDKFSDVVKGPFCFPGGYAWETNLSDVLTFKLFKLKGIAKCVRSYRLAQVIES